MKTLAEIFTMSNIKLEITVYNPGCTVKWDLKDVPDERLSEVMKTIALDTLTFINERELSKSKKIFMDKESDK